MAVPLLVPVVLEFLSNVKMCELRDAISFKLQKDERIKKLSLSMRRKNSKQTLSLDRKVVLDRLGLRLLHKRRQDQRQEELKDLRNRAQDILNAHMMDTSDTSSSVTNEVGEEVTPSLSSIDSSSFSIPFAGGDVSSTGTIDENTIYHHNHLSSSSATTSHMKEMVAPYGMNIEDEESRDTIIPDSLPAQNVFQEYPNGYGIDIMDVGGERRGDKDDGGDDDELDMGLTDEERDYLLDVIEEQLRKEAERGKAVAEVDAHELEELHLCEFTIEEYEEMETEEYLICPLCRQDKMTRITPHEASCGTCNLHLVNFKERSLSLRNIKAKLENVYEE